MPDLLWDDVRDFFDPELMGSLPDVVIEGTGVEDWQAVFDLLRSEDWAYEYSIDGQALSLPAASEVFAEGREVYPALQVRPSPGVLLNFWPHESTSVDFDIDLREFQGQERLDLLCGLFRVLGRRLGKPVAMAPEGDHGHPVLGYDVDADRVVLLAGPVKAPPRAGPSRAVR
ncbi:hypothetical protein [Actinomadura luteofluorescens]|uniref:hypothetical protein n=1 Tax=Actinomadura luteofluorescens TaxID=46163 RepID=UPI003D8A36F7